MTWINEICSNDSEKRSLLVAMGNDLAYVVQAVGPLFYWKTTDFPAARKGWTAVIIYQVLLAIWTTLILFLLRRDRLKAEREGTAERHVTDAEAIGEDKDVKAQEPYEK